VVQHATSNSVTMSGSSTSGGYVLALVGGILLLVGILLRLWLLGNAPINSDEATAGLVAHSIAHGHTYAFYWGQSYGGVEPYVLALNFLVLGQSPFVLSATPALLALVGSVLVWRIGLHLFQPAAAITAAVLSWIWSESSLWNSTREYGLHEVTLVFGLVLLLESLRIVQQARREGTDRLFDWAVLGASGGLGFWASPEIIYFAIPAIILVGCSLRNRPLAVAAKRIALSVCTAFVTVLPWIWATATRSGSGIPPSPVSYLSRLGTFFTHVLPMILGLRVEGEGLWEGGQAFGAIMYALLIAVVVCGAIVLVLRRRDAWILALTLGLYPFLYAAFPTAWFWNDGRYGISLTPILSLVIVGGLWQMLRPPLVAWVGSAFLVVACVSTLVAFNDGYGAIGRPNELTSFVSDPNPAVTALATQLGRLEVSHAYAGYWVANDLTFISNGKVTALALDQNRNPPGASNAGAKDVAWIFVPNASIGRVSAQLGSTDLQPGSITEPELIAWLTAHGVSYRRSVVQGFDVIVPDRNISPTEVAS
jgi:Dolichyl-phosphate-mannose-protein mannosyltransferase